MKSQMEEKQRRTQAERSAATRKALLDATIKCLFEHGYGATGIVMIAKEADVSRGAMLHQFPTKADLMAYVVEASFAEELDLYRDLLAGIEGPRERLIAYPDAVLRVLGRPSGIAVLEILLGSRSDVALREKLEPALTRIEANALETLSGEFPRGLSIPLLELVVAAARGLSIARILRPDGHHAEDATKLLQHLLRVTIEAGALPGQGKNSSPGGGTGQGA